jgi:hypothetical protein
VDDHPALLSARPWAAIVLTSSASENPTEERRMADCDWEKVYEHAADGSAVSGSLLSLIIAVKLGADVQIRYFRPGVRRIRRVEWHRTCSSVTIAEAEGGLLGGGRHIVSCAFTDIPDTRLDAGTGRTFIQEPYATEWQLFNTTGMRHMVKFDAQTSAVIADSQDNLGIAWYVRCYRTPSFWELWELLI